MIRRCQRSSFRGYGSKRILPFRLLLVSVATAAVLLPATAYPGDTQRLGGTDPPNFLVVIADDLGWHDVGFHGSEIQTPTLDALARRGVQLDQFYVQPNCTPTRAAFFTGRYPFRDGLHGGPIQPWESAGLAADTVILPEQLRARGYRTALIGKWHLGASAPRDLPRARGFDHHYGSYLGAGNYFTRRRLGGLDWHRNGVPAPEDGYTTDLIAREAVRWIGSAPQPFFAVVAFTAPHIPIHRPPAPPARDTYASLPMPRREFAAVVTHLDAAIASIVDALRRSGAEERTLVLFFSDNGAAIGRGGSNAPLRGGKSTLFEGGIRVPALAVWPGRIAAGGVRGDLIHVTDLHATIAALAGVETSAHAPDGVDLWPTLARGKPSPRRSIAHHVESGRAALREGSWKLVVNGGRAHEPREVPPRAQLFDLSRDPSESRDLSSSEPDRTAALLARLRALEAEAVTPLTGPRRRTPPDGFVAPAVWGHFEGDTEPRGAESPSE